MAFACVLALAGGCGKKKAKDDGSDQPVATSGTGSTAAPTAPQPTASLVTAAQVAAVGAQQSRLDELGAMLDKADVVSGPVALLDAITKLPEWTQMVAKLDGLKAVGDVATALKDGVTQLHALRDSLRTASQRLGNLKGELDKALADHSGGVKLADLKQLVSTTLRTSLEPLATQLATTITKVIGPVSAQLTDTADLIVGACAMTKLSGGGKEIQDLCGHAKDTFAQATAFLADLKVKPSALYMEVSAKLEQELGDLVDAEVKKALEVAQGQVAAALKLPVAGGAGSGPASAP